MAESVYKVVELVGTSEESWEKAGAAAVAKASESLRGLRIAEVVELDMQGVLRFIAPRRGCARPQRIAYVITDGLLVSRPATIRLPAVRAIPRRSR